MPKINCWEFKKCGREPGGIRMSEFGICPAAVEFTIDGMNRGKNGGRSCWAVSGTMCEDEIQGTFAAKLCDCKKCDFYRLVIEEEGFDLQDTREIRRVLILNTLENHLGHKYQDLLNLRKRPFRSRMDEAEGLNCWDHMQCGRELGGSRVDEMGVCPAAIEELFDGVNRGINGGRSCWAISGTLCHGRVQGSFKSKLCDCERCEFYQIVRMEQGKEFLDTRKIRRMFIMKNIETHMGKDFREDMHIWRKSSSPIACEHKLI